MKNYYVYILLCSDNSYYVGVTNNMDRRMSEHEQGLIAGYTSKRTPVKLVHTSIFNNINEAISFEKQIKKWRRDKKEALIKNNWDEISKLSKRYKK